jgi:hypothetical protein
MNPTLLIDTQVDLMLHSLGRAREHAISRGMLAPRVST